MVTQDATKPGRESSSIRIVCSAPDAREIFLTGTFNDWNQITLPMTKNGDGQWIADLTLPCGRYEYTFVVDGVQCCEPHLKNGQPDREERASYPWGDLNRILLVR